jgi:hypothetical protein
MQFLRDLSWWFIGIVTLFSFFLVMALSNLLAGQFWEVPRMSILVVYIGLILGFLNKISIFQLGDTLVHEIGHAQMAALTFGRVSYIRVERDTSGVTSHRHSFVFRRLSTALVSLCGPISSSIIFVITTRLVASELTAYWALSLCIFVALILVTTVRNFWGWLTGITLLALLYVALESSGYISPKLLSPESLVTSNNFVVLVILGVVSFNLGTAIQYSMKSRKGRNPSSDESKFSKALYLPSYLGARLIILIQLVLMWFGLSFLLGWESIFKIGRLI